MQLARLSLIHPLLPDHGRELSIKFSPTRSKGPAGNRMKPLRECCMCKASLAEIAARMATGGETDGVDHTVEAEARRQQHRNVNLNLDDLDPKGDEDADEVPSIASAQTVSAVLLVI